MNKYLMMTTLAVTTLGLAAYDGTSKTEISSGTEIERTTTTEETIGMESKE